MRQKKICRAAIPALSICTIMALSACTNVDYVHRSDYIESETPKNRINEKPVGTVYMAGDSSKKDSGVPWHISKKKGGYAAHTPLWDGPLPAEFRMSTNRGGLWGGIMLRWTFGKPKAAIKTTQTAAID